MPFKFSWGARTIFDDLTFEKFEKIDFGVALCAGKFRGINKRNNK